MADPSKIIKRKRKVNKKIAEMGGEIPDRTKKAPKKRKK